MKRDPARMTRTEYDFLIIGGGTFGACAAWDATLRGLSVALLEEGDFGETDSAGLAPFLENGLSHLREGRFRQARESLAERRAFMTIAPHLVQNVPLLAPLYRSRGRANPVLLQVYGFLARNRNRALDPECHLPAPEVLSPSETLALDPSLPSEGLTGAVLTSECQVQHPDRLTLAFLAGAASRGAQVANHLEVLAFLGTRANVAGVRARDQLTGETLEIRARLVANVSGSSSSGLLNLMDGARETSWTSERAAARARRLCQFVTNPIPSVHALLLPANRENGSGVPGTGRISFVPWRGRTLIGARAVVEGSEGVTITERDIEDFLVAIRAAHPRANLDRERLVYAFSALDYGESRDSSSRARRGAALADHETTHGTRGLITAHAGGFVSSRLFAEKLVDLAFTKLGREGRPCETRVSPLDGAVKRVHDYAVRETSRSPEGLDGEVVRELVLRHGARYREVLRHGKGNPALLERVSTQRATLLASVLHAARHEMAMTLADVVLRRTGLATIGHPGWKCLERCASLLGLEHGWTAARQEEEIASVEKLLRPFSPAAEGSKAKSLARNQTRASSGWVELETSGREPAIPASSVSTDSPSK